MSSPIMKPPVILVTGKNGQVGWELQRSLLPLGNIVAVDRYSMDLSSNDSIVNVIRKVKPDIVINAAAYTAVDVAEEESGLAMQVNGTAPGIMAQEAKKLKAQLIHYSTDYVFDGAKASAYVEADVPCPLNEYGRTKLAGERAVQDVGCDHFIFRTSWVYGTRGNNFFLTMLRLMKEREELKIVNDQHGTPTWSRLIAEVTAAALLTVRKEKEAGCYGAEPGLYHLTALGDTTWYGFAKKIAELVNDKDKNEGFRLKGISPISTHQYPVPAARPINSRISVDNLSQRFGLVLPSWEECLSLCMSERHQISV